MLMPYTLITGASSGIGYETALQFAKRGHNIIVVARNEERLNGLKQAIEKEYPNVEVIVKVVDLSIPKNVEQLYEEVKGYDLATVINNAGFGDFNQVSDQNLKKMETMIQLNVEALTILSTLFVKDFEHKEGTQIINVSSVAGYVVFPSAITYTATKFYVASYTEGLNYLLKHKGAKMRAKVLAPAATATEFMDRSTDSHGFEYEGNVKNYNTAEEMAAYLMKLYDSEHTIGLVDPQSLALQLKDSYYPVNDMGL